MNEAQNVKYLKCIPPGVIKDNAAFVAVEIDTLGYDHATIVVEIGVTDIAMAVLKLTECDATGGSFTDVTGGDFDGDTDMFGSTAALPSATDDSKFFVINVDLRARKRFLILGATAGDGSAGTYLSAVCILSRPKTTPNTAAEMGAAMVLSP